MRDLMQITLAVSLFGLIMNGSFYFVGTALGVPAIVGYSSDLQAIENNLDTQAQSFNNTGGFNPALIFGDFGKAITVFMNLISGHYFLIVLTSFGFAESFVFMLQVVFGFLTVASLIYLVSGRQ